MDSLINTHLFSEQNIIEIIFEKNFWEKKKFKITLVVFRLCMKYYEN